MKDGMIGLLSMTRNFNKFSFDISEEHQILKVPIFQNRKTTKLKKY